MKILKIVLLTTLVGTNVLGSELSNFGDTSQPGNSFVMETKDDHPSTMLSSVPPLDEKKAIKDYLDTIRNKGTICFQRDERLKAMRELRTLNLTAAIECFKDILKSKENYRSTSDYYPLTTRLDAAAILMEIDPKAHKQMVIDTYASSAEEVIMRSNDVSLQLDALKLFAKLDRTKAEIACQRIARNKMNSFKIRFDAASLLMTLDSVTHRQMLIETYKSLVKEDQLTDDYSVLYKSDIVKALTQLDPAEAIECCKWVIESQWHILKDMLDVADLLRSLDSSEDARAIAIQGYIKILRSHPYSESTYLKISAAQRLANLGHKAVAIEAYKELAKSPHTPFHDRLDAADALLKMDLTEDHIQIAINAYVLVATDSNFETDRAENALRTLYESHSSHIIKAYKAIAENGQIYCGKRYKATKALVKLNAITTEEAIALYMSIVVTIQEGMYDAGFRKLQAAQSLTELGAKQQAIFAYKLIANSYGPGSSESFDAVYALVELEPSTEHKKRAIETYQKILNPKNNQYWLTFKAAKALLDLEPSDEHKQLVIIAYEAIPKTVKNELGHYRYTRPLYPDDFLEQVAHTLTTLKEEYQSVLLPTLATPADRNNGG